MMTMRLALVFAGLFACQLAAATDDAANLKNGQPADVVKLIDRFAGCKHWAGEEPYDAERKREIAQGMTKLRCDRLANDEKAALKRYAKKPATIKALKRAAEAD